MPEVRKRKNSNSGQGGSLKRYRVPSGATLGAEEDIAEPAARCRSNGPLSIETPAQPPSAPSSSRRRLRRSVRPPCSPKDFYVYSFLGALYSSYAAPETGMPGPIEHFTYVSYPGDDHCFYELDVGHVMPGEVVEEHDLYNAALQQLEEEDNVMEDSVFAVDSRPPSQPDIASSPDPSLISKSRELKASNRTKDASYVQTDLLSGRRAVGTSKDKGKARYIPSDSGDQGCTPANEPDPVRLAEDSRQKDLMDHTGLDDDEIGRSTEGVEQPSGNTENYDRSTDNRERDPASGDDNEARNGGVLRASVHKGGRPPKAFFKKAAAVADAYLSAVQELMSTFGVSQKVAYMATGLQPRKTETRETSSWNVHQRVYKMEHPKIPGESVVAFKTRQHFDYELHIKPLKKDEKTEYREECEQTIMDFFFSGQSKDLKVSSPAKRVEAACKALQKLAQMISHADCEIQSFGGVNYIGPDKAVRASGGAIFVSSNTVMKAIKLFDIKTSSIMLTTGDFLQAVVAQEDMTCVQGAGSSVVCAEKSAENRSVGREKNGKPRNFDAEKETRLSAAEAEAEPPHVSEFKRNDFRKKGRSYLGLTYNKVNPGRTNIDWINLLPNAIRGKYKLINCILSPHPGDPNFAAEKIPLKIWQDIGKVLSPEDFHPDTGGRHPSAQRFEPWTDNEKKLKKGTVGYNNIGLILDSRGRPLLTVEQAEQLSGGQGVQPQAGPVNDDDNDDNDDQGGLPEIQNVQAPSGKQGSVSRPQPLKPAPAAPLNFEAPDKNKPRREASCYSGRRKEGSHTTTPPLEVPLRTLRTYATQEMSETQSTVVHTGPAPRKKVVFPTPAPCTSSVASGTRAFYVSSYQDPRNRGLALPTAMHSGSLAGPSRCVSDSSDFGRGN